MSLIYNYSQYKFRHARKDAWVKACSFSNVYLLSYAQGIHGNG